MGNWADAGESSESDPDHGRLAVSEQKSQAAFLVHTQTVVSNALLKDLPSVEPEHENNNTGNNFQNFNAYL
ncbi:hypothetical protein J6590_098096 [Homalodisca vitripennis]|nr:hypothetical protein J6590_098096 [Homalodisca vitripennis]